ncbi:DUF4179 domain-containing protein [Paenibacillus sp. GYB006]|uniref:DUF4179 domain-containing protein n=1 Tax=Paenibacillus sp. GYB006 TaxID=2994394 RepID=UPI002F965AAD
MSEKQDKKWENAFELNKQLHDQRMMMVSDFELDHAIRKGLSQGKKTDRDVRKRRSIFVAAAAMMSVFMIFVASIRVSPAFASTVRDMPGLNKFVDLIRYDSLFAKAWEHDFLQEVGISDRSEDTVFTVGSILADEDRILILYSLKGPEVREGKANDYMAFELTNGKGEKISEQRLSVLPKEIEEAVDTYEKLDFRLLDGQTMPERLILKVNMIGHHYEIPFTVDKERFAGMREVIPVDKQMEVDGQKVNIDQVTITPLQAKVHVTADPNNTMQINDLVDLRLNDNTDYKRRMETVQGDLSTGERTYYFESPYFSQTDSLTLEAKGFFLNKRDQVFTFNIETVETIHTPNPHIVLDKVEETGDGIQVSISTEGIYDQTEYPYFNPYVQFFNEDNTFTDAAGKEYPMNDAKLLMWTGPGTESHEMTFSIPKREYKQPLSFKVKEYPGFAKADINIKIK